MRRVWIVLGLLGLTAAAVLLLREPASLEAPRVDTSLSVADAMTDDTAGYARALEPRPFTFPRDHGPHPDFRTEWWYYTGNLESDDGHRFGFQLTFFRNRLAPPAERPDGHAPRGSDWASEQVWMAHFALSDLTGGRFHASERFSRQALGLAGAETQPWRVWLEDWEAVAEPIGEPVGVPAGIPPAHLRAAAGDVALDLLLTIGKPPVLNGDRGLSQKSAEPGNASYYYSLPRLPAAGTVRVGATTHRVSGLAWMDREWSTSALGVGQIGWDWFALHLDDGRDLMLYQLRRKDGTIDPLSSGTLVAPDASSRHLTADDFAITVTDRWTSPNSSVAYPAGWRLRLPAEELDLTVTPALADQELDLTVRYWEGAVTVTGTTAGQPISGRGYVELTGYTDGDQVEN